MTDNKTVEVEVTDKGAITTVMEWFSDPSNVTDAMWLAGTNAISEQAPAREVFSAMAKVAVKADDA